MTLPWKIMLKSLPQRGTTFNIISFGSSASSLFPSSVAYSAASLKAASNHVDTMEADFGGTEIRSAIEEAFRSRSDPNKPTSVFILTDGDAYDLDGVQEAVTEHITKARLSNSLLRLFCLGIGDGVSKVRFMLF